MQALQKYFPAWVLDWLDIIIPASQILLVLFIAWVLQRSLRWLVARGAKRYDLPIELVIPIKGTIRWFIWAAALLLALQRMGVSATVLWTAFTSFATVAALAFFAAWSVLSNLLCALLIFTVRPFRMGDYIEVLDTAEAIGAKGRVVDINVLYTTLQEVHVGHENRYLQIPNSLFFQRVVRRWNHPPPYSAMPPSPLASPLPPLDGIGVERHKTATVTTPSVAG